MQRLWCTLHNSGRRVQGAGCRVQGAGFRVSGFDVFPKEAARGGGVGGRADAGLGFTLGVSRSEKLGVEKQALQGLFPGKLKWRFNAGSLPWSKILTLCTARAICRAAERPLRFSPPGPRRLGFRVEGVGFRVEG